MVTTSSQNPPKRKAAPAARTRHGIKTLVATASLAATLGGWASLSATDHPVNKAAPTETLAPPRIVATSDVALGFPPLPTLMPPPSGPSLWTAQPTEVVQPTPTPLPQPTLRSVNQAPPQKVVHVGGGGGGDGGNGGGGSSAAAQTSSSR
ncbi:MAG TPA: hypothetical protein VF478_05580 [Anaerolineae bacterium]